MESNPLAPRQRNRRADRQTLPPQPLQPQPTPPPANAQAVPMYPQQPVYPQQQTWQPQTPGRMYQQPMATAQPMAPAQPATPMQQMPKPQATPVQQPMMPAAAYQPMQARYPQQVMQPVQQPIPQRPAAPQQNVQYAPRPKALNQPAASSSGWQQPTLREPVEVPHARASRSLNRETARAAKIAQREADAQARQEAKERAEWEAEKARRADEKAEKSSAKKKLPGWLTTALSLSFIAVLALIAVFYLMQAYLTTQEKQRIAAYEAVLNNYHVTESADGSLHVTWQDHIEKYAAQYNLQPAFVTAIIRTESSFRERAESNVGARGLMQLMPDTAEWIAGKLDDHAYSFDDMWEAETNIRYGCWYLGYLSRLFRGDPELVSAAYHAGQTTITQWLSDPDKSSDGVTLDLDRINDGPTKQYIGRVTQTYGIYQTLLYPAEAFGAVPAGSDASAAGNR